MSNSRYHLTHIENVTYKMRWQNHGNEIEQCACFSLGLGSMSVSTFMCYCVSYNELKGSSKGYKKKDVCVFSSKH